MRLQLLLACVVLGPDSCSTHPAVRSHYPLVGRQEATCDASLTGVWIRDSAARTDERWVVGEGDPSDSSCVLYLIVTDTTIARIVTDTLEMAWLGEGGWQRNAVPRGWLSQKQFRRDSARLVALVATDTLSEWEIRLAQRPAGLFVDLSREPEYQGLMGDDEVRTHWLWKAIPGGATFTLIHLNAAWLEQMSDSGHVTISHSNIDGAFVAMATGEELLALMSQFSEDTSAFPREGSIRLHR